MKDKNGEMKNKKVVYFFCPDAAKDPSAANILKCLLKRKSWSESSLCVDGYPVLIDQDEDGNEIHVVRTQVVICIDYPRYLPLLQQHFSDFDLAVMVNWHGGANAPDKLLCIHTVGDVSSGIFGPSEPLLTTNIARAMEANRMAWNLSDFRVTTEATHWSGIVYGFEPELLREYKVAFIDVEIGSTVESYRNPIAGEVIATALCEVFSKAELPPVILYCGGVHFEDTITAAVLHPEYPVALTHILPSRWIENENYTAAEGKSRISSCIASIPGGVDAIIIHEKLKKEQRDLMSEIASELTIPLIKRKVLKNPKEVYDLLLE